MEDTLITLFCIVDDFCQEFSPRREKQLITDGVKKRNHPTRLCLSEIMTIYIHFHQSHYRHFKSYYNHYVCKHLTWAFPPLVSYNQFVELTKSILLPLGLFAQSFCSEETGLYFIDSTVIRACHVIGAFGIS